MLHLFFQVAVFVFIAIWAALLFYGLKRTAKHIKSNYGDDGYYDGR